MLMFENICCCRPNWDVPIITFGSGAEYDRRGPVRNEYASSILFNWPIDPYGLSKNIITRRAITYMKNVWVLRLFGCFNHDEGNGRFIKSCIRSILENKPITVHQNRTMDFFFLDDIIPVIDRIFEEQLHPEWPDEYRLPRNLNLTYPSKNGLLGIAQRITSMMGKPLHEITLVDPTPGNEYTGDASVLFNSGLHLVGFHEGLRRTISEVTYEFNLLH
jgi:dTDP-4-dehydrorhamnose reductase